MKNMNAKLKKYAPVTLAVLSLAAAGTASADIPSIDVAGVTTYITTDIAGKVIAVGTAVITLAAIGMGIKWVKATFF